jgi:hypothetical protein
MKNWKQTTVFLLIIALTCIACDNGTTAPINVIASKVAGVAVSTPTLNTKTATSITINAATFTGENPGNQTIEYAGNGTNSAPETGWQDGLIFSGLESNTTYYIFARSKSNGSHEAGTASTGLQVTTDPTKAAGVAVSTPTLNTKTATSITINAATFTGENPGNQTIEYAGNGTNSAPGTGWQDGLTFSGLESNTTYYIFARAKENATHNAGVISVPFEVTTDIFQASMNGMTGGPAIRDAINNALKNNNDVIVTGTANINTSVTGIVIPINKRVIWQADLTVTTSFSGAVEIDSSSAGTLIFESGSINHSGGSAASTDSLVLKGNIKFIMTGGKITKSGTTLLTSSCIGLLDNSKVAIINGTLESSHSVVIRVTQNSILYVEGGTFANDSILRSSGTNKGFYTGSNVAKFQTGTNGFTANTNLFNQKPTTDGWNDSENSWN